MDQTLVILKPDCVKRGLMGEVIKRFEEAGLLIVAMKMLSLSREEASEFYRVHQESDFYEGLIEFMISGRIVAMIIEGEQAIKRTREMMGATDPAQAVKGTIRADLAENNRRNLVHGSDSPAAAREEIDFFFKPDGG
ncbi:MAG: nucleoside-diphosphate kinase [bacterium]|nr:nucleoside-diphosphate kinase [bacterium]